ncbi:MAG: response regulator [Dehalococcoidia bacterium]|nr:response regulator [Dehalococcoidia bacterium]
MEGSSAGKKRVLVVEDEQVISDVCSRVLVGEGLEVDIAVNGMEAEDKLQERNDYDLILIDIRTPVMNGKQLYQWLEEKHPELLGGVIFTTGDVMGGDTLSFLERVARPFLAKPFTPGQLRDIVRKNIGTDKE